MRQSADKAYEEIKRRVITGELAPNALIDEKDIAESLSISRTPVREALLKLQAESLVEMGQGRGIRVRPLSITDMREIYQTISGLEFVAVELISEMKPDREYLRPLSEAVSDMNESISAKDSMHWCDADEAFHRHLLRLSGNKKLCSMGISLRDQALRGHAVAVRLQSEKYKRVSTQNHGILIDKLIAGDFRSALSKHQVQRQRGEEALVSAIETMNLTLL